MSLACLLLQHHLWVHLVFLLAKRECDMKIAQALSPPPPQRAWGQGYNCNVTKTVSIKLCLYLHFVLKPFFLTLLS